MGGWVVERVEVNDPLMDRRITTCAAYANDLILSKFYANYMQIVCKFSSISRFINGNLVECK